MVTLLFFFSIKSTAFLPPATLPGRRPSDRGGAARTGGLPRQAGAEPATTDRGHEELPRRGVQTSRQGPQVPHPCSDAGQVCFLFSKIFHNY